MNANIQTVSQLGQLTAVQAKRQLDEAIVLVKQARSLNDVLSIRDANVQMEAFLRTRRAAIAMGDEIESLRSKLREMTLECELRQGELTRGLEPAAKVQAIKDLGVTRKQAAHCELASTLPRPTIDVVRTIQRRKGLDVSAADLAPLAPLKTEERKLVASQLGEVRGVREAIEKAKVLPDWKPTQPTYAKCEPQQESLDTASYCNRAREVRTAANTLVAQAERYAIRRTPELLETVRTNQRLVARLVSQLGDIE
jgi:hypothetical protein